MADLARQSVYSRLAGYENLNDADPTFRLLGSKKNWDRGGALKSESTRAPLRLALPAAPASRSMPGRFPETTD